MSKGSNMQDVPWWTSARLGLAVIGFFGFLINYAQRVGMSVAIVCMVNQTALLENESMYALNSTQQSWPSSEISCLKNQPDSENTSSIKVHDGTFLWSKTEQGHVLGSFFYGYLISQIPAGMLAESYSGKWVFFVFSAFTTIATLLTPLAANTNIIFLIVLRVISGIGSGACYPAMAVILSKWAPPFERSKLSNLTFAGSWMGNILAFPLSGVLCTYGFAGGWASIFYVIGGCSVLWLISWALLVSDTPDQHKRITHVEREYISTSLKGQDFSARERREAKTPWSSIITSGPVWAILIAIVCNDWGLYMFLTSMPTYMNEVLHFDIEVNGVFSALPFIGLFVNMNISPIIADKLYSSGTLRLVTVRKLMYAVGTLGAAVFMIALTFVDCRNPMIAVTLLVIGITISASTYSGFLVNPIDIAPQYAGTILGLVNGVAAACGFAAPYSVAALTQDRTPQAWQRVFYITGGIYAFGALVFTLLASAEIQPWARVNSRQSNEEERNQELDSLNEC